MCTFEYLASGVRYCFFALVNAQWIQEAKAVQNIAPCRLSRWSDAHVGLAVGISFATSVVLTAIISVMVYAFAFHRLRRFRNKQKRDQCPPEAVPDTSSTTPQRVSGSVNGIFTFGRAQANEWKQDSR